MLSESGEQSCKATNIDWKPNMDLTNKGNKIAADVGQKRHLEEPESFFAWFNDHLEGQADEVGELIKDDIWPNPLQYYLNAGGDLEDGEDENIVVVEDDNLGDDGDEEYDLEGEEGDDYEEEQPPPTHIPSLLCFPVLSRLGSNDADTKLLESCQPLTATFKLIDFTFN
eukprot:gene10637-19377_t